MKKNLLCAVITIFYCVAILAQTTPTSSSTGTNNFIGIQHDEYADQKDLKKIFTNFKVFEINSKALKKYADATLYSKFDLILGNTKKFAVNLIQNDIRSPDYRLIIGTDKGDVLAAKTENITYMGYTDDAAQVRMTINDKFIVGYFIYQNESYYLEPLNGLISGTPNDLFVFYRSTDVIPNPNIKCGLTQVEDKTTDLSNNTNKSSFRELLVQTGCLNIRLAIASDFDLYANKFGSSSTAVTNQSIAILNNVISDYASAFNKAITFTIVTNYVSTSAATSLETALTDTTASITLLSHFTTWASNGGFGVFHDLGSLWLRRTLDGGSGTVGLAWVAGVCSPNNRYNILNQNFTGATVGHFGAVQAHEIGHNFSCNHDASGSSFIMAPSVNTSVSPPTTWSAASISSVNTRIATSQCQTGTTALQGTPTANFTLNSTECISSNIPLTDASGYAPTAWNWTMSGGTPTSASTQNTSVSYSTTGPKSITLDASNSTCNGFPSNSVTKTVTIINYLHPTATCTINMTNTGTTANFGLGIYNVTLGSINKSSSSAFIDGVAYNDYSCSQFATLSTINNPISISVTVGSPNPENVKVFVDLNNDGVFQGGELLFSASGTNTISGTITIPNTAVRNTLIRMRIVSDFNSVSSCSTPTYGQVEDYGLLVTANVLPVELVNFTGTNKGDKNILNWQTASELNNSHFVVQKSKDGQNFSHIGTVKGSGTSTTAHAYDFTDAVPYFGINYYRLNQVDNDGKTVFSKIISVIRLIEGARILSIYPNPTQDKLTVEHASSVEMFEIVNTLGQIMTTVKPKIGTNQTDIATTELGTGIYFLRVNQTEMIRFVKY